MKNSQHELDKNYTPNYLQSNDNNAKRANNYAITCNELHCIENHQCWLVNCNKNTTVARRTFGHNRQGPKSGWLLRPFPI